MRLFTVLLFLIGFIVLFCPAHATPVGSAFTYQGELKQSGAPANGVFDLQFELFDTQSTGTNVGAPVIVENVTITDGIFSVELDFGFAAFVGEQRWLEIGVRDGASTGGFTGLLPRQAVNPAPYALHAESVAQQSVGQPEIIDSEVQRRINAACTNSAIERINRDGSVECQTTIAFRVSGRGFAVKDLPRNTTIETDIWEVVESNAGNGFNTTSKRFVAPEAGYYYLHAVVDAANGVTDQLFSIYLMAPSAKDGQITQGNKPYAETSGIFYLRRGQEAYVRLRSYSTTRDHRVDGAFSYFEGYKIQ